jgi:hypothetical protein
MFRYNFASQAQERFADNVQAVMHLALAGDDGSVRSAQLFEHRDAERLPEQIAVTWGEWRIVKRGQHDDGFVQAGKIEESVLFPVREGERHAKRQDQRLGRPAREVVDSAFAYVRPGAKSRFHERNSSRGGQRKAERLGLFDRDTLAESPQQRWKSHLTR